MTETVLKGKKGTVKKVHKIVRDQGHVCRRKYNMYLVRFSIITSFEKQNVIICKFKAG